MNKNDKIIIECKALFQKPIFKSVQKIGFSILIFISKGKAFAYENGLPFPYKI